MAELVVSIEVRAPAQQVWSALVDWPAHDAWMLFTSARRVTGGADVDADSEADGVGARIEAVTKLGPLAVRDPMTVTAWQPPPSDPARCVVTHSGKVVRGAGAFEVEAIDDTRSRVVWSEWLRLPLGLLGQVGWLAVRPLGAAMLRVSLRRFAALVESRVESGAVPGVEPDDAGSGRT